MSSGKDKDLDLSEKKLSGTLEERGKSSIDKEAAEKLMSNGLDSEFVYYEEG